jgi:large subunit ribosomal protein L10
MDEKPVFRKEPRPEKVAVVNELREKFSSSEIGILVNFQGLNVAEINELRRRFRGAGVQFKVYKNTLLSIALESLGVEGYESYLVGPTGVAFSSDAVAPAKVLVEFIKEFEKPQIKGAILGKRVLDAEAVPELTKLPSRDELIAKLVGGINAPIANLVYVLNGANPASGLVNVLQGTINKVVYVLKAIADQKEKAA